MADSMLDTLTELVPLSGHAYEQKGEVQHHSKHPSFYMIMFYL